MRAKAQGLSLVVSRGEPIVERRGALHICTLQMPLKVTKEEEILQKTNKISLLIDRQITLPSSEEKIPGF